ncbi:MAG: Glycosyl transferase group 1 [Candidatus Jorgensenbacteria bacterium GW2011_GWA1_48_11]|uniref:Glycosyl transferase group 1 n=1 Tax=Candidatus Jorgensenbacteria bacterium GW2011_GWA1_48_11 TaxID=1618660 RepID=A0A0G1UBE6_9BACT|nr:MAG: Glycosyl transferase group 1 [Candidatus Jorgensenbacteria bacterium GW2011_GWA1_48_11]KKW11979.1 MAG: Glycosyl transferase group 1 [Candidatus Jorgensenbacteria bacterium GW2011_GWB1_49_9]
MKITISAYGKFDLFRWAEGFEKKGMLHLLLTDFYGPKSRCLAWRRKDLEVVSPDKVRVFLWPRLAQPFLRKILRTDYWDSKWFDVWAARQIAGSSVVIARSSCALETIKAAKKIGAKTILYRGSSHVVFSDAIRRAEFLKWNSTYLPIDEKTIQREKEEYEAADAIFTPSSYAAGTYVAAGIDPEKMIHFPLGSENLFFGRHPEPTKEKRDIFRVLYVGNIALGKGVQYLLEAVSKIGNKKIGLILAGNVSEEMKPIMRKYADCFEYAGAVPHHKIGELYGRADIFAFPTLDDGFGQVLVEAMGFGLPVVTTDHSAGQDIIENGVNGFVVPAGSADALAEKILYLYKNPVLREEMGRNNSKKVGDLSIGVFIGRWVDFFKQAGWLEK